MCVIMLVNKERPTVEMIEAAWEHNDDGGGSAWREKTDGVIEVVWRKGLDLKQMIELCATAPLPYIAHFRVASIGGIRPSLTHPFPIDKNGSLALEGRTRGHVLFHNGHWKEWDDYCLKASVLSNTHIPLGRWSDTRAMAWLCAIYGNGFMEFFPEQKGIVFGPTDMQIFDGSGWDKVNTDNKGGFVWCSNNGFMKHSTGNHQGRGASHNGRFCRFETCTNQTIDDKGFCFLHPDGRRRNPINGTPAPTPATGGSRVPPSPFVQVLPLELGIGELVTIEVAEKLHKEKQISKNLLKKVRRHWEIAASPGTKAAKRAEQALKQISASLTNSPYLSGLAH